MPCDVCERKSEEIREILKPYNLHLVEPVGGVRLLAEAFGRLRSEREAWVIEGGTVYWRGRSPDDFTADISQAVRFARPEDAERVLHWIVPEKMRALCRTAKRVWQGEKAARYPSALPQAGTEKHGAPTPTDDGGVICDGTAS